MYSFMAAYSYRYMHPSPLSPPSGNANTAHLKIRGHDEDFGVTHAHMTGQKYGYANANNCIRGINAYSHLSANPYTTPFPPPPSPPPPPPPEPSDFYDHRPHASYRDRALDYGRQQAVARYIQAEHRDHYHYGHGGWSSDYTGNWKWQEGPRPSQEGASSRESTFTGAGEWYASRGYDASEQRQSPHSDAQYQPWLTQYYPDNALSTTNTKSPLNAGVAPFRPQQQQSGHDGTGQPNKEPKKQRKAFQKALEQIQGGQSNPPLRQESTTPTQNQPQFNRHQRRRMEEPHLHLLEKPTPTALYRNEANKPPEPRTVPHPLLIVLDLNGTLLYRQNRGTKYQARPHLNEFINYLFANHKVMVWSSAKPYNVGPMCRNLFTPEQYNQIVAIWSRDQLRLPAYAYTQKVQVYKQLSWIWNDTKIQAHNPVPGSFWDHTNTILIDDSIEKAASEPHNLVEIEEFEARPDQMATDVLGQVASYLDEVSKCNSVASYIRNSPFKYRSEVDEDGGVTLH